MVTRDELPLGQTVPPPPEALRTGDLLWPRPRDAFIPYILDHGGGESGVDAARRDKVVWEREVQQPLRRGEGEVTAEGRDRILNMSYDDFRKEYSGGAQPFGVEFSVGHVAMVDARSGYSEVVEALWGNVGHVIHRLYAVWANEHASDYVWLGQVSGQSDNNLSAVLERAQAEVGKLYDFIDLRLDDDQGFYCSKLVWFSFWCALRLALDDDPDPNRGFWYSPKQLMHSPHVTLLQGPCNY